RAPGQGRSRPIRPGQPARPRRLERSQRHRPLRLPLVLRAPPPARPLRRPGRRLMLHPDSTVLLTDALRPPAGYQVDHAVATTYSLTLTAMLIAPMTFTLG